jgi:hypothetical protein
MNQKELSALAVEANKEHELATTAAIKALEHAVRCGELLMKAKDGLAHGFFYRWLKANFKGSERTAANYMKLAARTLHGLDLQCRQRAN